MMILFDDWSWDGIISHGRVRMAVLGRVRLICGRRGVDRPGSRIVKCSNWSHHVGGREEVIVVGYVVVWFRCDGLI